MVCPAFSSIRPSNINHHLLLSTQKGTYDWHIHPIKLPIYAPRGCPWDSIMAVVLLYAQVPPDHPSRMNKRRTE